MRKLSLCLWQRRVRRIIVKYAQTLLLNGGLIFLEKNCQNLIPVGGRVFCPHYLPLTSVSPKEQSTGSRLQGCRRGMLQARKGGGVRIRWEATSLNRQLGGHRPKTQAVANTEI